MQTFAKRNNSSFIMIDYTVHCRFSIYNKMTYSQTAAFDLLNEPH